MVVRGEPKIKGRQTYSTQIDTKIQVQILYDHKTYESWFTGYGLLKIEEYSQRVHIDLQSRTLHVSAAIA